MKRALVLSLLTALLGGCVVAPYGYRDRDDYDYYRDRDDYRHGRGYHHGGYDGGYSYGYGYSYRDHEHGS